VWGGCLVWFGRVQAMCRKRCVWCAWQNAIFSFLRQNKHVAVPCRGCPSTLRTTEWVWGERAHATIAYDAWGVGGVRGEGVLGVGTLQCSRSWMCDAIGKIDNSFFGTQHKKKTRFPCPNASHTRVGMLRNGQGDGGALRTYLLCRAVACAHAKRTA